MWDKFNPAELVGWWLLCGLLVLIMQLGFMMLEAGSIEQRHRSGVAVKNLAMMMISVLGFSAVGYGFVYGAPVALGGWNIVGHPLDLSPEHQRGIAWQFCQTGYAVIAATIASGALAGRTTLQANVLAALMVATVAYPLVAHAVWGGGMFDLVSHDFAGAATVHVVGGLVAGVGAWAAGPRWDRSYPAPEQDFRRRARMPRRAPILDRDLSSATYGVLLLTIGWLGFNGGSITGYHNPCGDFELAHAVPTDGGPMLVPVGYFFIATCVAGAAGGLVLALSTTVWNLIAPRLGNEPDYFANDRFMRIGLEDDNKTRRHPSVDFFYALSAVMAGMVAITACADLVYFEDQLFASIGAACLVGASGGIASVVVRGLVAVLRIDDPVDAVAVHVGGGLTGLIIAGILLALHKDDGWLLLSQAKMIGFAFGVSILTSFTLFVLLHWFDALRCTPHQEAVGLTFGSNTNHQRAVTNLRRARTLLGLGGRCPAHMLATALRELTAPERAKLGCPEGLREHGATLPRWMDALLASDRTLNRSTLTLTSVDQALETAPRYVRLLRAIDQLAGPYDDAYRAAVRQVLDARAILQDGRWTRGRRALEGLFAVLGSDGQCISSVRDLARLFEGGELLILARSRSLMGQIEVVRSAMVESDCRRSVRMGLALDALWELLHSTPAQDALQGAVATGSPWLTPDDTGVRAIAVATFAAMVVAAAITFFA